jgi:predicted SpoU family rRNA methylase
MWGRSTRQLIYCSTTRIHGLQSHMPKGGVQISDQSENMRHTQRESLIIVGVIATALGGMFVSCMVLGMVC